MASTLAAALDERRKRRAQDPAFRAEDEENLARGIHAGIKPLEDTQALYAMWQRGPRGDTVQDAEMEKRFAEGFALMRADEVN